MSIVLDEIFSSIRPHLHSKIVESGRFSIFTKIDYFFSIFRSFEGNILNKEYLQMRKRSGRLCDGLYSHLCVFFSFLLSLLIFPRLELIRFMF